MADHEPPDSNELRRTISAPVRGEAAQPMSAVVRVEFGAHSRAGAGSTANEDHFVTMRLGRNQEVLATSLPAEDLPARFDEYGYALLVANGIGPHGSGAMAGRIAISTIAHLAVHNGHWNLRIDPETAESVMDRAVWFYERAALAIDRYSEDVPALEGMGTSISAAFSAGDELFYAHVGSSRLYLFREGELIQLTRDHTLDQRLNELGGPVPLPSGSRNLREVLTEVVGGGRVLPQVDVERLRLHNNDILLLCSQGLCDAIDDETIADVLAAIRQPNELAQRLTELAATRDAGDATALVAKYTIPMT